MNELLIEAIDRWGVANWRRFDDGEVNCTIQLFKHAFEASLSKRELRALTVHLEAFSPTPEMLDGLVSVVSAKRPDLRVSIAHISSRVIECKLLGMRPPYPRAYVREGIMRFVTGDYGPRDDKGVMVGYVHVGLIEPAVRAVNAQVDRHPDLGTADHLVFLDQPRACLTRYRSHHVRSGCPEIDLSHYLIRVQA